MLINQNLEHMAAGKTFGGTSYCHKSGTHPIRISGLDVDNAIHLYNSQQDSLKVQVILVNVDPVAVVIVPAQR